ncbi:MAG: tetratricopeptide repeat protein, partial [Planctomycetota bacterium]
ALAQIQLARNQPDAAIETLKSAIARDPGSLAAERAKEILAEHGSEYVAPIDPNIVLTVLKNSFPEAVVPTFAGPEKIISFGLNLKGSEFYYGNEFGGIVAITNNSTEPLIVSDNGLFKGRIRVDASISGDLDKKIPNLVSIKIRPTLPIEPGRSMLIPLRLATAELRQILLASPQASLNIEFTVYLDPVITADGKPTNSLAWIEPARVVVRRPAVALSRRYLQNRLNSLSRGQQGQKIKTAQLFTGLLMEQHMMANREPLYKFKYADWMPAVLKSALVQTVTDNDWVVKVHTMAGMLSLPLNHELTSAVAENLDDTHWPVRLMAVFLLAKAQGGSFHKVLDSTAKYDSNELVRRMAIALGGAQIQQQEKTPLKPTTPQEAPAEAANPPKASGSTQQPPSIDNWIKL